MLSAAAVILCMPAIWAYGQRPGVPAPRPGPRANAPFRTFRPRANGQRPPAYPGPPYMGQGMSRPAFRGYAAPTELPPGHLGAWLYQHRNLPVQDQERMLRSDPNFQRLPPNAQQRVVQQLHQVNELSEEQRQRRLARAEIIEHLSPQDRMQITNSAHRWAELQPDRQALMKNAFRDLRSVPLDQRQTVLNSARYQGVFNPEERGILGDMLRVEPYEPAR